MNKILILLFILLFLVPFYAQDQDQNLTKYWSYRDRLRQKFMVVTEDVSDFGVNIPAASIIYDNNEIWWGDANSNMSHYLSVLATELWLLKNNNQDYSQTLKELLYAMLALERRDVYSESVLRWKNACGSPFIDDEYWEKNFVHPGDINGFSLRDDVSTPFWSKYQNHFDVGKGFGTINRDVPWKFEENSQDVIIHTMEGLGLISKLVGTESIAGIPCNWSDLYFHLIPYLTGKNIVTLGTDVYSTPISVNFSLWAKDIVKRFIGYIQYPGTLSVQIPLSINTSIGTFNINYPIADLTHWVLVNPVTNVPVMQGSGMDGGVALASNGFIKTGLAITGEDLREYGVLPDFLYNYEFQHPVSEIFGEPYDDNLTRSLACNGNIMGAQTFTVLRDLRDSHDPFETGRFPNNEHLPLMYLALHDPDYSVMGLEDQVYNTDKVIYEELLNSAPANFPASDCGVWDWSSASRCIWQWKLGEDTERHVEYNGLDYMMLHNLYYIAFRKEDYKTIIITDRLQSGIPWDLQYELWINKRSTSQRAGFIETNSSILGNNVTYTATRGITLKKGFNATGAGGKKFIAKADPLPNNYQGGLYALPVTAQNSSSSPSNIRKHSDLSGTYSEQNQTTDINNQFENVNISVYPNPNKGYMRVSVGESNIPVNFDVINTNSAVVYKSQITSDKQIINLSELPQGVYFIRFYMKNSIQTKKIILI